MPTFFILLVLALLPLLGLVCLHWHFKTCNIHPLRKAFWLAFSASVFWSLLANYIAAIFPGWGWLIYVMLAAGTAYMGTCAWHIYDKRQCRLRHTLTATGAFAVIFGLIFWLIPNDLWLVINENAPAAGDVSRLRSPL